MKKLYGPKRVVWRPGVASIFVACRGRFPDSPRATILSGRACHFLSSDVHCKLPGAFPDRFRSRVFTPWPEYRPAFGYIFSGSSPR